MSFPIMPFMKKVNIPRNGLVAEYLFSGNANDTSGNGNTGIVSGATLTTDRKGAPNSAFLFNGISDYITAPSSASLDLPGISNAITISCWVKNSDISQNNKYFINYGDNMYALIYGFTGDNYEYFKTPPTSRFNAGLAVDTDWNHILIRTDATKSQGYYNNSLISDGVGVGVGANSGVGLFIGANSGVGFFYGGAIDDARIYDRYVTDSERDILYNE